MSAASGYPPFCHVRLTECFGSAPELIIIFRAAPDGSPPPGSNVKVTVQVLVVLSAVLAVKDAQFAASPSWICFVASCRLRFSVTALVPPFVIVTC